MSAAAQRELTRNVVGATASNQGCLGTPARPHGATESMRVSTLRAVLKTCQVKRQLIFVAGPRMRRPRLTTVNELVLGQLQARCHYDRRVVSVVNGTTLFCDASLTGSHVEEMCAQLFSFILEAVRLRSVPAQFVVSAAFVGRAGSTTDALLRGRPLGFVLSDGSECATRALVLYLERLLGASVRSFLSK